MSIDGTIAEILRDAERLFGDGFEGTAEQYAWLATKVGLSADDDLRWRFVIDPEADDKLDPDRPQDEALVEFLSDDDAVERFLTVLAARYRAALEHARPAPSVPPRPAHSEAFLRVRNRLIALEDDADRSALARLFGAIGAPERDPSRALAGFLREVASLDDDDVVKFARWCRTYLTRTGQVPQATARSAGAPVASS